MAASDEPPYVLDTDPHAEPPFVTKSGRVLTEADIDALVEEAESGYDPERLRRRRTDEHRPKSRD